MDCKENSTKSSKPEPTPKPSEGKIETASVHGKDNKSKPKPTPKPSEGRPITKGK